MLTNSQIQEFRTKGFLLGQKILTDEEVDELPLFGNRMNTKRINGIFKNLII